MQSETTHKLDSQRHRPQKRGTMGSNVIYGQMPIADSVPLMSATKKCTGFFASSSTTTLILFTFGILFTISGYSDTADKFCIQNIDQDTSGLLGPNGSIVQWNKELGIAFLIGTAYHLFIQNMMRCMVEKAMGNNGVDRYIEWFLAIIFVLFVFVYSVISHSITLQNRVSVECRNTEIWFYKMPLLTMQLFSVFSLVVIVTVASIVVVMGMVMLFVWRCAR